VVPDDESCHGDPLALDDPPGARTPPTPPVVPSLSPSPAPCHSTLSESAGMEEAKKLLTIIININYFVYLAGLIFGFNYIILVYIKLDFKPADVKHSSLRTMAKHGGSSMGTQENWATTLKDEKVQYI
jgi:hypothetical protein